VTASRPLDLERLRRAVRLDVVRLEHGQYVVHGHTVTATVTLECDCADAAMRGARCKHILAVEYRRGISEVLAAVAQLVPARAPRPCASCARRSAPRVASGRRQSTAGARGGLTA
jgi:hypothetical protein